MDRQQFFQTVLPFLGSEDNIIRYIWQDCDLYLTVKDAGALQLEALRMVDTVAGVELSRGRVKITMQGTESGKESNMAKNNKFEELAGSVIELVGGKENYTKFFHCVTRLRLVITDKTKVDEDAINAIACVVGTKWADNQLQIIIGTDVADAYHAICEKNGIKDGAEPADQPDTGEKKKFSFMAVIEAVTGCIIPLIPVFMGCALVRTIGIVLGMTGVISTDSSTYQILDMVGIGSNYFMPVLVAATAAKRFGATETLAMGICALLLAPTFTANVAEGAAMTLFGLPVYSGDYSSMLFPSIIVVFVMSYVEKFFKKHIRVLQIMLIPLCTVLVMVPLQFCLLAPVGLWIGEIITSAIMYIYTKIGFLAVGLLAGLFPLLVFTGMHTATIPAMMTCYMTYGFDPLILPSMSLSNFNQGMAALGVMLKSKNKDTKATALGAAIPALAAGVTEPALFGVNFPNRTPLIASVIGGFVGGCYLGIQNVGCYGAGGLGVMSVLGFISPEPHTLVHGMIAVILSMAVSFVLTLVLFKDKKGE